VNGGISVSVVVPVLNGAASIGPLLDALGQQAGVPTPTEFIVVDNGSTDGTAEYLTTLADARVVRNAENRGFAAACNQGMAAARGKHVLLLNNDVVLTPDWLDGLLEHVHADPRIGIVGPRTNFAGGPQQVDRVTYKDLDGLEAFAREFRARHRGRRTALPRITGLCMLVSGPCFRKVGALDERFGIGNFEDDDYCVRARLEGFTCVMAEDVFVHHFGSQTFRALGVDYRRLLEENKAKFLAKWKHLTPAGAR
jgi:GT2 family glycosyltransferase